MHDIQRHLGVAVCAAFGLFLASGCGDDGPRLVPVKGTVTINGKPLGEADLTFVPDPSNKDVTPGADRTGPEGNYMARFNARTGLAPGKYKVLISKKAAPPAGVVLPDEIKMDPVQQEMMGLRKETLPKKYADATEATEMIDVGEEGGVFDFDVKASSKGDVKTTSKN